jgi:hypothetical protein
MNVLIVMGAAEAAAIGTVEVAEALPAIRAALKNLKFDGPSPGFAFRNGRAFGIRWGNQGLIRVDLHPMSRGEQPRWHVHFGSREDEHGLRIPLTW